MGHTSARLEKSRDPDLDGVIPLSTLEISEKRLAPTDAEGVLTVLLPKMDLVDSKLGSKTDGADGMPPSLP